MNAPLASRNHRGCTPHLFAILVITIVILIILKFSFSGLPELPPIERIGTPTPSFAVSPTAAPQKADLFMYATPASISAGQAFTITGNVNTNNVSLTAADISLRFDPEKLRFNDASAAAFFPKQVVFEEIVDNQTGRLRIAVGTLASSSASGILFTLKGTVLGTATGSAYLTVSPDSRLGIAGQQESVLGLADPILVFIDDR